MKQPAETPRTGSDLDESLEPQFRLLEKRIDAALDLVGRLRREKQELEARLAESAQPRHEAVRRLNEVLDKIDALL